MGCCGKRVSFTQTSRKVAISPNGNTLPNVNSTPAIPNNVISTCVHVYQPESTFSFGGRNYTKMKCTKCGHLKTVYLV